MLAVELDPGYCNLTIQRFENLVGEAAYLIERLPEVEPDTEEDADADGVE